MKHSGWIGAALMAVGSMVFAQAQDEARGKAMEPQREHQLLKKFEGEWDVRCTMMLPGEAKQESKGSETARVTLGGFWVVGDFKGEVQGKPFEGRYFTGYDPEKRKYVGSWISSMGPYLTRYEGQTDSAGKSWTFRAEGYDPKLGRTVEHRMTFEFSDEDHYAHRFYGPDASGQEVLQGEMHYARKGKQEAR